MQLTERHYKCIEYIIKGYKYTEIAKKVPCSRQAIYDWLEDNDFKAELDKCRQEIKNTAQNKILGKTDTYLEKIEDIAFNSASDNVKLNALTFLWETVYGKATSKIEQTTENKNKDDNKVKDVNELLEELKENNIVIPKTKDKAI